MSVRAYLLLNIADNRHEHAARNLRGQVGVIAVDPLEGHPNLIITVEAASREELATLLMPVLGSVDSVTEDLQVLVTQGNGLSSDAFTLETEKLQKRKVKERR
jgi:hypothetical protein